MTLQLEKWDCLGPKTSARAMNRGFATIFSGRQPGLTKTLQLVQFQILVFALILMSYDSF